MTKPQILASLLQTPHRVDHAQTITPVKLSSTGQKGQLFQPSRNLEVVISWSINYDSDAEDDPSEPRKVRQRRSRLFVFPGGLNGKLTSAFKANLISFSASPTAEINKLAVTIWDSNHAATRANLELSRRRKRTRERKGLYLLCFLSRF